ncbi:Ribosomal RNA large subunit methyltransferase I [Morella rubra]|uniref:Ribosomal RNA large subunit methyltransferase I n=1 Tax=Morella rubra TaxID=262757 RepID=A0A6A1VZ82_9ROSI|nr:Ribosomal RNA large subunit methyltransferase I [Morella rubra]
MVYSGAVDRIIGRPPPRTGDIVLVADGKEKPIGWGLYNSVSMFCVRLMQLEEEATRDPSCAFNMEKLLEARIDAAVELRKSLGLPSAITNAYRLVNSEGDRLSGLIVDIFGDVAVVASSAAWVEKYKQEIEAEICRIENISHIYWRPSVEILKEEGLNLSDLKEMHPSAYPERTKVMENGISYAISLEGQKTGFYADQRENRHFISMISDGKEVLDICCYSGGFALNAARGGAVNVTGVDTSSPALELAKENIVLNDMDPRRISFLREDAIEFMKSALSQNESWDLVILDPPKLAPRRKIAIGGVAKVVLKKGKTQLFKNGSPMVYSGAVDRIIGRPPPRTGDIVLVADGKEKPIGWGLYNSVSMFCVRLMQLEEEATRDPSCAFNMEKLLEARIDAAVELRKSLGLPSAITNAYRLVNSEGDRLSGLIVDIFGDVAVVASSAAWVEKYKQEIEAEICRIENISHIYWRPSVEILKEEGLNLSDLKEMHPSAYPERTKVMENGISYAISLEGQKTGFYADQRENRHFISMISDGKEVLDICCYSGGFALNAARGGAVNVTGVDTSSPALELAKENIVLNDMDPRRISFLREDAIEFMKSALSQNESWDLVILDPPKLAPRRKIAIGGFTKCSRNVQNFKLISNEINKERWTSHDLFMFRSYDPKWDILVYAPGKVPHQWLAGKLLFYDRPEQQVIILLTHPIRKVQQCFPISTWNMGQLLAISPNVLSHHPRPCSTFIVFLPLIAADPYRFLAVIPKPPRTDFCAPYPHLGSSVFKGELLVSILGYYYPINVGPFTIS